MPPAHHPLRFAFVSTMRGVPWGGSEELWSAAALRLRAAGHQVQASVLRWAECPAGIRCLQAHAIPVEFRPRRPDLLHRVAHKLNRRPTLLAPSHLRWLQRSQADLVVISQGGPWDGIDWMLACYELGLPYCAVIHANSELWWPTDDRLPAIRTALTHARAIHFVSQANQHLMRLQTGLPLEHSEVVDNPTKIDRAHAAPVDWPADDGRVHLACVGRLTPSAKGQDLLLQVLALPQWRERPVHLSFYGAGDCAQSLQALAGYLGLANVTFRGHVGDLREIWAENHLLVMPSRFEGLPIAILEAMLCGRPVLVTDVAGCAEYVSDGVNGFLAAAPSVALLDQTLERAWADRHRWRDMGAHAFRTALDRLPLHPVGDYCARLLTLAGAHASPAAVLASPGVRPFFAPVRGSAARSGT